MKKKSMLVPNKFWKRVKVKKGTKDPFTGADIIDMVVPTDEYFEIYERLFSKKNNPDLISENPCSICGKEMTQQMLKSKYKWLCPNGHEREI